MVETMAAKPSPIASVPGVDVGPGETALTRTPCGPYSAAHPRRPAPRRFDCCDHLGATLLAAAADQHLRALTGKRLRGRSPDPGRSARDERSLSYQLVHAILLSGLNSPYTINGLLSPIK